MPKSRGKPRKMFCCDLDVEWQEALQKQILPLYPDEKTRTSLISTLIREFVSAHLTEAEMHELGLLPTYRAKREPELLKAAIEKANLTRPA